MKFKTFEIQMFGSIKISNDTNSQNNYSSTPAKKGERVREIETQKVTL